MNPLTAWDQADMSRYYNESYEVFTVQMSRWGPGF